MKVSYYINYKSYAKINLFLNILEKENDLHNIESLFQTINFSDKISLHITENGKKHQVQLISDFNHICSPEKNLIYKAGVFFIKKFKEKIGENIEITIHLDKKIPFGAGLGGGSSNAGTLLALLNKRYRIFSKKELISIAFSLGSDVPFFLKGGTAIITGTGDKIKFINPLKQIYAVIISPFDIRIPTKEAYSILDREGIKNSDFKSFLKEIHLYGGIKDNKILLSLFNSFQNPIIKNYKELYKVFKIIQDILSNEDYNILLSGSGSSLFFLSLSYQEALLKARLLKKIPANIRVCRFVNTSFAYLT